MKNTLLHLQYKHSGTFANRKYEELSYPKNQKMCDPILVTLLKMRPHYSQSSRELQQIVLQTSFLEVNCYNQSARLVSAHKK